MILANARRQGWYANVAEKLAFDIECERPILQHGQSVGMSDVAHDVTIGVHAFACGVEGAIAAGDKIRNLAAC